jgi:hypothetical protein
MNSKQPAKKKLPLVRIKKSLDQYSDKVLFKEKLEEANQTLKRTGLPGKKRKAT